VVVDRWLPKLRGRWHLGRCRRGARGLGQHHTIGFGDSYDRGLLERIAAATHRGRFVPVQSLRELTDALLADQRPARVGGRWHHRAEVTVLALDLSPSMLDPMAGRTKLAVVQEAVTRLLAFKQRCFS
jgi:hypothetical protein